MDNYSKPGIIPILEGIMPYLGSDGRNKAETLLQLLNTATSEPVRQALGTLTQTFPKKKPVDRVKLPPKEVVTEPPFERSHHHQSGTSNNNLGFLFLIVIVLLFFFNDRIF